MKIDLGSIAFNAIIECGGGTPSWGTALGQSSPDYKITYEGAQEIVIAMTHCYYNKNHVYIPLGKGGRVYCGSETDEIQQAAVFKKVFINGIRVNHPFTLLLTKETSQHHLGRKSIKYSNKIVVKDDKGIIIYSNDTFYKEAQKALKINEKASWFVYAITPKYQDELHFSAIVVNANEEEYYEDSAARKNVWVQLIAREEKTLGIANDFAPSITNDSIYRPYLTAIKSKPFVLLAGISGTGKSRIVRELARACWDENSDEYHAQKPRNFEMVQVKPNWHDSSELLGYVSRIGEHPVYVVGEFIKFVARAWEEPEVPYFLCLDEMNLAPVEQYFAEFLSVVESRKADATGMITTDPILKKCAEEWYLILCNTITSDEALCIQFKEEGIALPQNLIVVGTVNMDETTFSFSRKVLDRAMTIEMNEVDLKGGLTTRHEPIGKLDKEQLIATAVEGVDIYEQNKYVCDIALEYLQAVNNTLDGTPFKIAYRTRNEFLLYVVNNLPYNKDAEGKEIPTNAVIAKALDEVTCMKILPRIEGDDTKVTKRRLADLKKVIADELSKICEDYDTTASISILKLEEMDIRLDSGYTNFWS